ncbi:enoyl-CoA hydratase/isomerase family protein [Nonomuraea sp. FMUSA5-5]|uniref:Enoyl-CoA hydratase/isomerase family protein n=1 Tax=Nonomuraea composti TaxID=2720023 RepID=A0ABX1BNA2_9ACTN|nr:enoyl-CoA hydratase-related protein [Nonomuraea sp. FMUSA5-5]NJP97752.1 enoyl-CoA hydratase/isomerase family protein [Nonomuraea sp. FMUSA5-5]
MPVLDRQDDVFILDIGDNEDCTHPDWIDAVHDLLDKIERCDGPRSLVTFTENKFFPYPGAAVPDEREFVVGIQSLLARLLTFPMVTVAALRGHTFAAGAMISLAHDFRVMRRDRGSWWLPQARAGLPLTAGMSALLRARLTAQVAHEAVVTARRFDGYDALAAEIVDRIVDVDTIRQLAVDLARDHNHQAGPALGEIKARLYAPVVEALQDKWLCACGSREAPSVPPIRWRPKSGRRVAFHVLRGQR